MKLNPASFLAPPAALAASLGQQEVSYPHKSIAAVQHDIEFRSVDAIDEKYSDFRVSSSWKPPSRKRAPAIVRRLGADQLNELARVEPRFAVLLIAGLMHEISRFRGWQNIAIANIAEDLEVVDLCEWICPKDSNRLLKTVTNYLLERADNQVRFREDWTMAKTEFFPTAGDDSIVLGRVNDQGSAQRVSRDRVPYLTLRDRIFNGKREAIAVFEDGSGDILTNIKIRRVPIRAPQSNTPADFPYAETRTGMAGRPSAKDLTMVVLGERAAAGLLCDTVSSEAKAVKAIVEARLRPQDAKPRLGTVENHIRLEYHKAKNAGKGTS